MRKFSHVWLIALAVKTALAITLPLSNDEAYYWVWGHHPQWSYFDHPPAVGWLFWLGTWMENLGHAARLPGVWLGHLTLLIWHRILTPYLDDSKRTLWLIFVLFSPFLGAGSLIITPDVPMLFFWSLSLLILLRALEKPTLLRYLALGASLGLGFCSKYLIVLFVPITLAWIFVTGKWRQVKWAYVPATLVSGLLFCAPVLYWNSQNNWASFAFQLDHGLASEKRSFAWPFEYLGAQIALLFPPVIWLATRRREPKEASFLHFFGWLPIAFFLYTSFKARVEANWPMMAHPALLSLAFLNMRDWRWLKVTLSVWVTALVLVLTQAFYPWIPVDPKKLKTSEFNRFDVLIPELTPDREVYLGSYQMAGALSYKLRRQIYKLGGMNRRDFYDFAPQSYPDSDTFFVGAEATHPLPAWVAEKGYEIVSTRRLSDELHLVEVKRRAQGSGQ